MSTALKRMAVMRRKRVNAVPPAKEHVSVANPTISTRWVYLEEVHGPLTYPKPLDLKRGHGTSHTYRQEREKELEV